MNFDKLPYGDQKAVVLALLCEYSTWDFQKREVAQQVITYKGWQYTMGWKECAERAAAYLVKEHLRAQKFGLLVSEMQKFGLDNLYRHLMHEHLSEALK